MHIVILITAKDKDEAQKIADCLVSERLAACANIAGEVDSVFRWKGKVDHAHEVLVILKSKADLFSRIADRVKSIHSYEVPEIIALPIAAGSEEYLRWVDAQCGPFDQGGV